LKNDERFFNPKVRFFDTPWQMNLELTTRCPLHCPQCYVSLNQGTEMNIDTALYWIRDAAEAGIKQVNLSGGETLCYPHLKELILECKRLDLSSAIALSGVYAEKETLKELIDAGVDDIFISLNGSTREINSRTRDGYELAVRALETLKELEFENRHINWVMHSSNADDFPSLMELAEKYGVNTVAILAFKPDSSYELKSYPTKQQMTDTAAFIKKYKGNVKIVPEPCFSQMRAYVYKSFLGNLNMGPARGCGAGRNGISVAVDGRLTPCRHLDVRESFEHISDYWNNSDFLKQLRSVEENRKAPCKGCIYENNCLPCQAVGYKLHEGPNFGMEECPVHEAAENEIK